MQTIFLSIIPIFILILVGVILQKLSPKPSKANQLLCKVGLGSCETMTSVLNRFALYLALPALIISSLSHAGDNILTTDIIFFNIIFLLISLGILYGLTRFFKVETSLANTYFFTAFFGNVAYIGIPFLQSIFPGTESAISILVAIHIAIAFTIGLFLLERSRGNNGINWKLIVKNPLLLSVALGVCIFVFDIELPNIISQSLSMLGASASPVVLVAIGTFIASQWRIDASFWHGLFISGLKLIFLPIIFVLGSFFMTPSTGMTISILEEVWRRKNAKSYLHWRITY